MKFRVTAAAAADVRSIVEYLSVESPLAKSRFEARLDAVLVNIRERPLMGRRTDRRLTRVMNTYPFPYLIYLPDQAVRDIGAPRSPWGAQPEINAGAAWVVRYWEQDVK